MAHANPTFADLFCEASIWTHHHELDYNVIMNAIGHTAATNINDTVIHVHNTSLCSLILAFVIEGNKNVVYLGHSPYLYPADVTSPTPMDARIVVLVGNRFNACIPVVLPVDAFGRTNDIQASDIAAIVGAAGHGAAPPVFCSGPLLWVLP
jgi:hypothetical protein